MSLLDKTWKYTPSGSTNIRKLFAKVRRELEAQRKAKPENVTTLREMKKART